MKRFLLSSLAAVLFASCQPGPTAVQQLAQTADAVQMQFHVGEDTVIKTFEKAETVQLFTEIFSGKQDPSDSVAPFGKIVLFSKGNAILSGHISANGLFYDDNGHKINSRLSYRAGRFFEDEHHKAVLLVEKTFSNPSPVPVAEPHPSRR